MSAPSIRPRFEMGTRRSPTQALELIADRISRPGSPCEGSVLGRHVHLNVQAGERRLWSPHLYFDVVGDGQGSAGSIIRGRFGPRADVWTLIVALYAVSGFVATMAVLFAISQVLLDNPPTALWAVLLALITSSLLYLLAWIGQRLSADQMKMMKEFIGEAVGSDRVLP